MSLPQPIPARNLLSDDPLEIFRARARTVARHIAGHFLGDKQDAIDGLLRYAAGRGLDRQYGVDAIHAVLAEAFK